MVVNLAAGDMPDNAVIKHISPVTGRAVSVEQAVTPAACRQIAGQAAAAFQGWSVRSAEERAQMLVRLSEVLDTRVEDFRRAMSDELGTPVQWARHNVTFAAEMLREVATYAGEVNRPEQVKDHRNVVSRAERIPCGVCLGIAPWNAPLILGVRAIAAPLLCGNTVLLKGSEFAPRTFRLLGQALADAGLPENVTQVLLTRPEDSEAVVEALIATPVVRRVNFTGSTRVGRRVAELCAKYLKRSLLELGGQATLIVLGDADLDAAAEAAVCGAYVNQGQVCMSTERLVVDDTVADALLAKIETRRAALKLGDPNDETTDIGPVIGPASAERLSGLVGDAIGKGAILIGGGQARGAYFEPTLVDRVEPEMRLYHEEIFGPILSVTRVVSDLDALTVANDSEYGLSSSVFSSDLERAESIASRLHTGICHINRPTIDDNPHAPFGGVKHSGYGRFGGRWALHEFTELRWITRPAHNS